MSKTSNIIVTIIIGGLSAVWKKNKNEDNHPEKQ